MSATLEVETDMSTVGTLLVSGDDILLNGVPCDPAATTATVGTITITDLPLPPSTDPTTFIVDLGGGHFAPGANTEGSGTSEIEFQVSGLEGVQIHGTSGSDVFSLGSNGLNLNDDDDVDMSFANVPYVTLSSKAGADEIRGRGDGVVGGGSPHELNALGGPDADLIRGGPEFDFLAGDQGNDDVRSGGVSDLDIIVGGSGDDVLVGGSWIDYIEGNDGNDRLDGAAQGDDLIGGAGRDVVVYSNASGSISADLKHGFTRTPTGRDSVSSIEDVIGSDFGDDIVGSGAANHLLGGGGNDFINGRGGSDDLDGQLGPRDFVSFTGAPAKIRASLQAGTASGWGSDSISDFEEIGGSAFGDRLTGDANANELNGAGGNDTLRGLGGADHIGADAGRDRVFPGPGTDVVSGDSGRDTLDLSTASRSVAINLLRKRTSGDGMDQAFGFENAVGTRFADSLVGNGGANQLLGGRGDDIVGGQGGADRLVGGPGQDRLNGGDGPDRLIAGAAHDVLRGGAGDDNLQGGDGPDLLHGDAGNDALNGGPGTDTCYQDGGSGPKSSCEKPAPPPSGGGGGGSNLAARAGVLPALLLSALT